MAKKNIILKKGDTFLTAVTYLDESGNPTDITDVLIRSQVRDRRKVVYADMEAVKEDQENPETLGKFTLVSQTDNWPIGELYWDIQYTTIQPSLPDQKFVQSSDTVIIEVIEDVTVI